MNDGNSALEFGVVILGAGRSRRMGRPKLLLPWKNSTVLGHSLKVWAEMGARQLAVVCAADDDAIAAELAKFGPLDVSPIRNAAPERGMFSSIQCAAAWRGWARQLTHCVLALGDQPHLQPEMLKGLLRFASSKPDCICQPGYRGHARHPVVFPTGIFWLLSSSRCASLKEFLKGQPIALWETNDPALELDLDSPEDYARATRRFG